MKILIVGASGKTGRQLLTRAVAKGHKITAFVRSAAKLQRTESITVFEGDARNPTDLVQALQGQDAVICALGTAKAGDALLQQFTAALLTAADQTGIKRIIMLSSFLLSPEYKPTAVGRIISGLMRNLNADKTSGEQALKASSLDWTIVYATVLDKAKPGGTVRIVHHPETVTTSNGIARADVADYMLSILMQPETIGETLTITVT